MISKFVVIIYNYQTGRIRQYQLSLANITSSDYLVDDWALALDWD